MSSCTSHTGERKKRWPNATAARYVADLDEHKRGLQRGVYRCRLCSGWHVFTKRDEHGRPIPVAAKESA